MRRGFVFLWACSLVGSAFSQAIELSGIVVDEKTRTPLPFVNVVNLETRQGMASDIDGRFRILCSKGQSIEFRYVGFATVRITADVSDHFIVVALREQATELNEIEIRPGSNPALAIIRKVIANRNLHDPENLPSFSYNSYNKLSCALQPAGSYSKVGKDSVRIKKFVNNNLAFVSESYTKKKFERPNRHKEVVLGNRFSGVKDPFFSFLATDLQPFGFYKEIIPIMGKNYLSPISDESIDRYDYTLMDTVYQGADSIFVISFEPLPGKSFEGLKGQLYVSSDEYALAYVLAQPSDEHLLIESHIQQKYEKKDRHWFPVMLNSELIFKAYKVRNIRPYYYSRSYLSQIRIGEEMNGEDFDLLNVSFDSDANNRDEQFWMDHRTDSLTRKELNTYKMYDSLNGKLKSLNTMMKLAEGVLVGKFKAGSFYLPLEHLLRFNQYEGLRLGLGLQTGEHISRFFSLEGFGAYGLKDKAFKYGGSFQFNFNAQQDTHLRFSYIQDVMEPGNSGFIKGPSINGGESFRRWLTARMDSVREFRAEFSFRPLLFSHVNVFLDEQRRNPTYSYLYQNTNDTTNGQKEFVSTSIGIQWRYALRESFTQVGNSKIVTERSNPQLQVSLMKSISGLLGGQYNFTKLEIRFDHNINWVVGGKTIYELAGGYSWGAIPYPFLYNAKGTLYPKTISQGVFTHNYFQTMGLYEFVSDQYVYLFLEHNFGRLTGPGSEYFRPELTLIQNTGWGTLHHPEYHKLINIKTLENGYFESGVLITNILRLRYLNILHFGLGGGIFYRYGPNALSNNSDNVVSKIFISASF